MSIRRITISVPSGVAARIRKAAAGASVSSWVTGVIEERLDDEELEARWQDFCRSVNPDRAAVRRGDAMFKRLTHRGRKTAA